MIDDPISQFMNRDVLHAEPTAPLSEIVSAMNESAQSAVVICEDGAPVGVITERDIVRVLDQSLSGKSFANVLASEIMTSPIHTLSETSQMAEVIRVMNQRRFRRVPIVDDKSHLSGIVNLMELQSAMNVALERRGRGLEVAVMERTAELQAANAKLAELSIKDSLTGLLNRRAMGERLDELHDRSRRYGNAYSIVLLDIDHFKNYNDALGHVAGDEALQRVAKLLNDEIRTCDFAFRYGGEEFLLVMPETGDEDVHSVAERIRRALQSLCLPHPDSTVCDVLTMSMGHTSVDARSIGRFETWRSAVEEADSALYEAKQSGRNCVVGSNDHA